MEDLGGGVVVMAVWGDVVVWVSWYGGLGVVVVWGSYGWVGVKGEGWWCRWSWWA